MDLKSDQISLIQVGFFGHFHVGFFVIKCPFFAIKCPFFLINIPKIEEIFSSVLNNFLLYINIIFYHLTLLVKYGIQSSAKIINKTRENYYDCLT